MHKFTEYLKREFLNSEIGFQELGEVILNYPINQIEYQHLLNPNQSGSGYTRIPVIDHPLEVTLLHWPAGGESAVHWHEGFYGYVIILDGSAEDLSYQYQNDKLCRKSRGIFYPKGILAEPDGVIHKIINSSKHQSLTSLHIYYPAIKEFAGMKLFNIEERKIGTLSKQALKASWSDAEGHFESVETNAFTYSEACHDRSHEGVLVCPKPDVPTIQKMITAYYNEQANEYDNFDTSHSSRNAYTQAVDDWIVNGLNNLSHCQKFIDIACGTGRRSAAIAKVCTHRPQVTGVDISDKMLAQAHERGLHTTNAPFTSAKIPENQFDAATYLYAFGHIPTRELRLKTLQKIHAILKPGGSFFGDFFNVENTNEWGPEAQNLYTKHRLEKFGYEPGDIFYAKTGGTEVAFIHYFTEEELVSMFMECGFQIRDIRYIGYVKNPGEPATDRTSGNILLHAIKP